MRVYESICISMFVRFPKFCFSSSSAFERKKRQREEKKFVKEYLSSSQQQQRYTIQHYFENLPS